MEIEAMTGPTSSSIADRSIECRQSFHQLCNLLNKSDVWSEQISLPAVQDEFGRFRVWAGNVGAHRSGRVSLDYRLREAEKMRQQVTNLLNDLESNLREALAILSGKRLPYDEQQSGSDSSDSSPGEDLEAHNCSTEIQQIYIDIKEIISCLYELSIILRNPAPRDRILKLATVDVSHFEEWDTRHVEETFPRASSFLLQRLGKANTKRRQMFKYLEIHHLKLARDVDAPVIAEDRHTKEGQKRLEGSRSGLSTNETTMNTQTTVSTFLENNKDMAIDEIQSETSSAVSEYPGEMSALRVPSPPKGALDGQPFECPYCYDIIKVSSAISWRGHVFKDLKPYVCTFGNCALPNQTFDTRREWFDHETQAHRRQWPCFVCQERFLSETVFVEHVRLRHPESFADHQLQALVDMCVRLSDQRIKEQCPLCLEEDQYTRSHVARHMLSLALFILPRVGNDKCYDIDSNGVQVGVFEDQNDSIANQNALSESDPNSDTSNEAVNDALEALENDKKTLGEEHPTTLLSMANLAVTYRDLNRLNTAENLGVQVIEGRKRALGVEHPDTLASIASLASTYSSQGRWKEAEELLLQALEKRKRVLGVEHPDTLTSIANLASTYSSQGRWKEAEELELQVLEIKKRVLGWNIQAH